MQHFDWKSFLKDFLFSRIMVKLLSQIWCLTSFYPPVTIHDEKCLHLWVDSFQVLTIQRLRVDPIATILKDAM